MAAGDTGGSCVSTDKDGRGEQEEGTWVGEKTEKLHFEHKNISKKADTKLPILHNSTSKTVECV